MAKVLVTMPDKFLNKVDRAAKAEHRSRSEWIREALRERLQRPRPKRGSILHKPNVQWALNVMDKAARKKHNPNFDSVAFIRKMRGPLG
ncbi:MAG: ribbon-helix-helix protein, CopG family [Chloroflexi bacterium]|nr:ribbon-helix-helix protein, CopG family [Chloroflexota bacterium]